MFLCCCLNVIVFVLLFLMYCFSLYVVVVIKLYWLLCHRKVCNQIFCFCGFVKCIVSDVTTYNKSIFFSLEPPWNLDQLVFFFVLLLKYYCFCVNTFHVLFHVCFVVVVFKCYWCYIDASTFLMMLLI